ncbi:MAG TPA: transposase [Candidatus Hydrogenedentes bacterium]|jgi:transposase|nr:transposase [Candidatus Hydrogenedentota bacterium]
MSERKWAGPELARDQYAMMSLDDLLAWDHRIRVVDALLEQVDWSPWEEHYRPSRRGQPAIHPRLLAGCILYGLMVRVRSSRQLEDATRERLDFQWCLGRRSIDHATFADFRTDFGDLLSGLNDWFAQRLCESVENALDLLVSDGTRIRANCNVHGGRTGETLKRHADQVARLLNERLAQMAQSDADPHPQARRIPGPA